MMMTIRSMKKTNTARTDMPGMKKMRTDMRRRPETTSMPEMTVQTGMRRMPGPKTTRTVRRQTDSAPMKIQTESRK